MFFLQGFYLYLYFVSILFMGWLFSHVIKQRAKKEITRGVASIKSRLNERTNKSITDDASKSGVDEDGDDIDNLEETPKTADNPHINVTPAIDECTGGKAVPADEADTHSEDSDDKLSPLPTEENAQNIVTTPLLGRRQIPVPTLTTSHSASSLHAPPSPNLTPINHHLHHHPPNLHVTISSGPGHDGLASAIHQHHGTILKNGASGGGIVDDSNGGKRKVLSRTQSIESSKYDGSSGRRSHFGSFYLRMGAVAFGVGSMIYSCLEFGQFLEQEPDTKCHSYMQAITPVVRIVFTFMQVSSRGGEYSCIIIISINF